MAWYISLTLRWSEQDGQKLDSFLEHCETIQVPNDRIRVPRDCMHSTLFAFSMIERITFPCKDMRESARLVLDELRQTNLPEVFAKLQKFRFRPVEIKHFTNDTTVQFELENNDLENLRTALSDAMRAIQWSPQTFDIKFPFDGGAKNSGNSLWGSIARHPTTCLNNALQQVVPISENFKSWITAQKAIFTISDDSLGNTLADGDFVRITLTDSNAQDNNAMNRSRGAGRL
jgi:hypothetical protein